MNRTISCLWATFAQLRRFQRDESGVATLFGLFMIMMMVLVGGIGVDLMHTEMERVRLQQTLDRAVLAAADRDQTLAPEAVVQDYFDKAGMRDYLTSVTVNQGLNFRSVTARASTTTPTQFMHLMGVSELSAPGVSQAEERVSNVEVSLVLDISGSMAWNNKMANLRTAAKEFVNSLINEDTADLISVSLVPYSEHVNVGAPLYNELRNRGMVNHRHPYSTCLEIPDAEFASPMLNTSIVYDQMQHFQWNFDGYDNEIDDTVCPHESYESILPISQSVSALESSINQLQPRAGTSIFLGVKWAAALLDPSTRPIVTSLINGGAVDGAFNGRPVAYDDEDTLKTIVVMTDGKNSSSSRIRSWAYDSSSDYYHWSRYNFWYYLRNYVYSNNHYQFYTGKYTAEIGDGLMGDICTAAKAKGIIIWGVGFEVDNHGANVLKSCASSPSHFFRVEGVEIRDAFAAIASQINQLRLTQ